MPLDTDTELIHDNVSFFLINLDIQKHSEKSVNHSYDSMTPCIQSSVMK